MAVLGGLCLGLLGNCKSDDNKSSGISNVIVAPDPGAGFLLNSTPYSLAIDFQEAETFSVNLAPGKLLEINLTENKTYTIHVVALNAAGRVVSEYNYNFYINDVPLDSQLADFVCNWFVEFMPKYAEFGFTNRYSP